ncbi:MAG: DciA family protein [Patescibacteria group bacterium]|jgi:predicted nucleic acid-binding Zn ribbon protein|nr:DciA family protein [Patescibacteria group bacterium]
MGNLGGTFDKRMKQLGLKKHIDAAMIVEEAQKKLEELFGDHGKENLRVVSYRNGVLKVAASSNIWATECQGKVNKLLKHPITRVQFVVSKELINRDI